MLHQTKEYLASTLGSPTIEFGNEINTAGYDGDFPIHASGRVLGLSDLNNANDPEAAAVAAGYRVYLKPLAEL